MKRRELFNSKLLFIKKLGGLIINNSKLGVVIFKVVSIIVILRKVVIA